MNLYGGRVGIYFFVLRAHLMMIFLVGQATSPWRSLLENMGSLRGVSAAVLGQKT